MPTADEVIVEFEARIGNYERNVKAATAAFEKATKQQRADMARLERDIARNSNSIGSHIKGLAGTLAAAFTGHELAGLLDAFTRLQNNMRVAGVEGNNMKEVQDRLYASAQRYGVSLEQLSSVFSAITQSSKDLGASQEQVFTITDAVSASLKVTGASAESASGALLQLQQLFRGSKVQAQEYNSLIDTLFPLLQAVANGSDKWAGSVGRLSRDVKDSKVSTKEFFDALVAGSSTLEAQAAKANLTLGAGLTTISNALIVYFGEADKANGVSAALGATMQLLAENLDIIIPALAVIAVALTSKFVVGAIASSVAVKALIAHLQIATYSFAGFGLAARSAGAALLAAFGGPVGLALTALTVGLVYAGSEMAQASIEADRLAAASERNAIKFLDSAEAAKQAGDETSGLSREQIIARSAALGLSVDTNKLADAHYRAAAAARVQAIEEQKLATTMAARKLLKKSYDIRYDSGIPGMRGLYTPFVAAYEGVTGKRNPTKFTPDQAREFLDSPEYKAFKLASDTLGAMMEASIEKFGTETGGGGVPASDDGKGKKPKKPAEPQGVTREQLERRFLDDMARLQAEELAAMADLATTAQDRAAFEQEILTLEAETRRRQLEEDIADGKQAVADSEKMTELEKAEALAFLEEQRKAQAAIIDSLYGVASHLDENGQIVVEAGNESLYAKQIQRKLDEELLRMKNDMLSSERDTLEAQAGIAINLKERYALELSALALGHEIENALLEQAIANGQIADADKARALMAQRQAVQREELRRDQMSPMERFQFDLEKEQSNLDFQLEQGAVDALQVFNDGLVDAIVNFRSLGDVGLAVLKSITAALVRLVIQQLILKSLGFLGFGEGGSVGGGGGLPLPGFAGGGPIRGRGGPRSDKVLIRASPEEYMIQASAARKLGRQALDHMNSTGQLPVLPGNATPAGGGGSGGMGAGFQRDIKRSIADAVAAMPPINLYPTLTPGNAMRAALKSQEGRRAMFEFFGDNSGELSGTLRR